MTAIQVIPKDARALSMLKLLADMGIIQLTAKKPRAGSLAEVVAEVEEDVDAPLTMAEIVAIVKEVRTKHHGGSKKKTRR